MVNPLVVTWLLLTASVHAQQSPPNAPVLYSQGDPTDDEQYLIQKLNRARLDPAGEGQRLADWLRNTPVGQEVITQYGTDPDQMVSDFAALPAVPPLAFDPHLLASSRSHSADMAAHNTLSHIGSDGSTPVDRVQASGFPQAFAGENAALGFSSLDEIHAGYLVDWGNPGLGHRVNSMTGKYGTNVVGIGIAIATEPDGDLTETEDFGSGALAYKDDPAMLVGVVYADADGNGQYDPGEGTAGVKVTMDGGAYNTLTSASGGYALPLVHADGSPADGIVTVRMRFPDGGLATSTATITRHDWDYGASGTYRGNIEWDATAADDLPSPFDPDLPRIKSKPWRVGAGEVVEIRVYRPLSSDPTQPLTVGYKVRGTAIAGVDFAPLPGTVNIPAGRASAKIEVTALAPTTLSPGATTTLVLKLMGVSGAQGKTTVTFMP